MIELQNVTKTYRSTNAIDCLSLQIPDTGIYCLLGRNGAGKTTLMKMLAGHIAATDGEIIIDGKSVSPSKMPDCVNYLESGSTQFNMTVSELIKTAAHLQEEFDQEFAFEMAKRLELNSNKKYKQLSFGMRTMVTAILTLSNNSKVILLDEPVLGFDAIMRSQFNTLLLESYQAHPRVIIVSTHLIDEIAKVTEHLIIINNGRIQVEATLADLDERAYTLAGPTKTIAPLLGQLNCIGQTTMGSIMAAHIYDHRITPPAGVTIDRLSLQDFFINIVGGKRHE